MRGQLQTRLIALGTVALLAAMCFLPSPTQASGKSVDSQMEFGIRMAKRGLWNEALFRFSRVLKERPGDPRVLNNMAVAYEAIGQFDKALEHYKSALERDSSNRDLRRNYAQFVEFYQGLKPESKDAEPAEPAEPDTEEDASDGAAL
jgi:Tfp pilus assembly protein PilF